MKCLLIGAEELCFTVHLLGRFRQDLGDGAPFGQLHALSVARAMAPGYSNRQSGGDIHVLAELIRLVGEEVTVMSAIDALLLVGFAIGARGAFAATCSLVPHHCVELYDAAGKGNLHKARQILIQLLPLVRAPSTGCGTPLARSKRR